MARPLKIGFDYFPFSVDFFEDRKIRVLRIIHGLWGELVLIKLYTEIYKDKGYYMTWDEETCLLLSEELSYGKEEISPQKVNDIVVECCKRDLFDKDLFENHGVLTSRGIQRRFLLMAIKRTYIPFAPSLLLLDPKELEIYKNYKNITFTDKF